MSGITKKINRPGKVRFTPFDYKVHWTKAQGASTHGETSLDKKEILMNEGSTLESTQETLCHESCHVLLEDLIHMIRCYEGKDDDAEELFTRIFSPRLFQFLRDNPEWIKFVTRGDK